MENITEHANKIILADHFDYAGFGSDETFSSFCGTVIHCNVWDANLKKRHGYHLPRANRIYIYEYLLSQHRKLSALKKRQALSEIEVLLSSLPKPMTIRSLFHSDQDYLSAYHGRGSIWSAFSKLSLQEQLIDLYNFLKKNYNGDGYTVISVSKAGWVRKFILCYFEFRGNRVLEPISLCFAGKFCLSEWRNGGIRFYGSSGSDFFSGDIDHEGYNFDGAESHRSNEIKKRGVAGRFVGLRVIFGRLVFVWRILRDRIAHVHLKPKEKFKKSMSKRYSDLFSWKYTLRSVLYWVICFYRVLRINFIIFATRSKWRAKKSDSYVIYALHYFPEGTTIGELTASEVEYSLLKDSFEAVPFEQDILVFEHPAMLVSGERPISYERHINKFLGVRFVHAVSENGIPFEWLSGATKVITIRGCIALEAVLVGTKAEVMALSHFQMINGISLHSCVAGVELDLRNFYKGFRKISVQQYLTRARLFGISKVNCIDEALVLG